MSRDAQTNQDQATYWNEQGGARWVALERDLDAQLEPYGSAVASILGLASGDRVLDVGCGAGATSLMLAMRVRPGQVLGVDISAPLLERARQRAEGIENLRFEDADAQTFTFAAGSHDVVFSRFGVMFFADPLAAFRNLHGALRSGGKVGFVCWRPMSENPSFALPLQAALPFLPEAPAPPEPGAPGPFAFADDARIREILDGAGFRDIAITPNDMEMVIGGRSDLESAVELVVQIGPLGRALSTLPEATRTRAREAVREAFSAHHTPNGVRLPSATWIVTARKE